MASFDVKRVTQLEWAGIGAGALAFIASFFNWFSVSTEGVGFGLDGSIGYSAWNAGFLAWFSVLLLVAAGVLVLLPHLGTQVPNLTMIWLGLSGLAVLFIVLRWITFGSNSVSFIGARISVGASFGLFIGLILAIVSGVAAFLTYRSATTRTSA
jgi:hypothetical protein